MKHPKEERTLVVIKPDGIQRTLMGEIIKRYEQSGLKLVGIKMLVPTEELVNSHYLLDPEWPMKTGLKPASIPVARSGDITRLCPPLVSVLSRPRIRNPRRVSLFLLATGAKGP